MANIWFTSDLHIKHRAVAYDRRYGGWPKDRSLVTDDDVKWHDDTLASNWDSLVGKDDIVWVLGDLIANPKSLLDALAWVSQRPGIKHLILGNHDPAHPMNRDSHKWLGKYQPAFDSPPQMAAKRKINGQDVLLSHFPYEGDGDGRPDRESQWRLPNEGMPIMHGHTHSKEQVTFASLQRFGVPTGEMTPQIHVGVDAWGMSPVPLETIQELL